LKTCHMWDDQEHLWIKWMLEKSITLFRTSAASWYVNWLKLWACH
jgi:hypothetical protein